MMVGVVLLVRRDGREVPGAYVMKDEALVIYYSSAMTVHTNS